LSDVSEKVLKITVDYIGPSSKTFLERQTRSHMNGLEFADLQKTHLPELSKWVGTSAGLLIGKDKAGTLAQKILNA
jgi:hypothetical protein